MLKTLYTDTVYSYNYRHTFVTDEFSSNFDCIRKKTTAKTSLAAYQSSQVVFAALLG